MTARADLLALTEDALVSLTNRGLYKRAAKEVAAGTGPAVAEDTDAVRGTFPDGVVCALPLGGLEAADCTCGASGACRHVVAVVLAYQAIASNGEDEFEEWSPAEFTDEELEALLGKRNFATARRRLATGYLARVHPATATEPVPWVELPNCSVRFLVPHDLAYARSDVRDTKEAVALAVWAWRAWAVRPGDTADRHFAVGGTDGVWAESDASVDAVGVAGSAPEGDAEALASAVDLAADIFLTGVSNLAAGFTPRLARVRRDLDSANLRWPLLAAEDLADQVAAHADRAARHQQVLVADLLAELVARARVAGSSGGQPRSRVLGTEEAAEVALRRLRLTALGCRVLAVGADRRALVFLADPAAGVVLTLDGRYQGVSTGSDLVGRRLAGSTVGVLAGGNVVTETAHRRADRRLRLAVNRVARTTVSQSGGAWGHLPGTLLARDLDALAAEFDRLPPRLVRPRVDAEDVRVVEIAEVEDLWYEPGSQRLTAVVRATGGGAARVVSEHRSITPGALDALADALRREPRYVSATVRRGRGGLVLTPIAVVAEDRVVVPDLASGDGSQDLDDGAGLAPDPLTAAIEGAFELLAEMPHRGARHLPASFGTRLDSMADRLDSAGLGRCAADLRGLNRTLGPDPQRAAFDAWADAAIRLITTAELR